MKKIFSTIMLITICTPITSMAGIGILLEGDVCSSEYFYTGVGEDPCSPGLTCVSLAPGNKNDYSGVCCSDGYSATDLGTNCTGCHDWQEAGKYQTKVTGKELCQGFISLTTSYRCSGWYYGYGTDCTACPSYSTCPAGSTTFSCNQGYYANGSVCSKCPTGGTTSGTGAVGVSSCCMTNGATFSDATGTGFYNGKCCAS